MTSDWSITQHGFDPRTARAYEGLFTLGNGRLHIRGSLEEHFAAGEPQNREYDRRAANVTSESFGDAQSKWGTYVPGIFAKHPTLNNQMVNLPWFLWLVPEVDGERLDVTRVRVERFERTLHLRDAVLRRTVRWMVESGARVECTFERFVSTSSWDVCFQRLTVSADRDVRVRVLSGVDADVRTNGFDHFSSIELSAACWAGGVPQTAAALRSAAPAAAHPQRGADIACSVTTDSGDRFDSLSRTTASIATDWQQVGTLGPRRLGVAAAFTLPVGSRLTVEKRTAVTTSRGGGKVDCRGLLSGVGSRTFVEALGAHVPPWRDRWRSCDVLIEGGSSEARFAQRCTRLALFHMLRCLPPDSLRTAIDAKGYAGEAYWGRYFWDTEMYLLPFYLYTMPREARALVDFRVHTLDGARRNARRYGYPGARYAWESDHRGDECCPNWQYADHEIHVTADVVYALDHYARATDALPGNAGSASTPRPPFLSGPAASVLVETARYWMERISWQGERPRILGVMGPDEYTPISNDNAFTNRLVAHALACAARHGHTAGAGDTERDAWHSVSARLQILRGDLPESRGVVLQCEGFDSLADPRFDRLWIDRTRTFAAQVSQERMYRSKCLKQADVLMMMMLFEHEFTREEIDHAWRYYLPYTTHDSSLSAGAHCIIACRLGRRAEAWEFFRRGAGLDLPVEEGGEGGAAEGIHIAGAGAVWQMIVFGFAGVRTAMQSDELRLEPHLPDGWDALEFPLVWRGQRVGVRIERTGKGGSARALLRNLSSLPVEARVGERTQQIDAGATAEWAL